MATHASALKRARQSERRRERNSAVKSVLKTHAKKVLKAAEEKNSSKAQEGLAQAIPAIHRAAAKGIIHRRTAARRISRLTKKVNALTSSNPTTEGTSSE